MPLPSAPLPPRRVYAALLAQVVISAGTDLYAKRALAELPPMTLLMCRFLLSGALFTVLLALAPAPKLPPRRAWVRVVLLGLLACPVNQATFFYGLSRSVSAHAALLYALTPVGVFLYQLWRSKERATARLWVGIGVAFVGVVVLLLGPGLDAATGPLFGDLFILVAVASWVLYTAEGKGLIAEFGWFRATSWTLLAGVIVSLPATPFLLDVAAVQHASGVAWSAIVYLAALTSVVSYFLWYYALGKLPASRVAVFSNLQPVATALAAWAILGDPLTWEIALGGALVIAGVRWAT